MSLRRLLLPPRDRAHAWTKVALQPTRRPERGRETLPSLRCLWLVSLVTLEHGSRGRPDESLPPAVRTLSDQYTLIGGETLCKGR